MMDKKKKRMSYQEGGRIFKPCPGCPTPAKCRAAGKCLKKEGGKKGQGSGGGLVAPAGRSAKVS